MDIISDDRSVSYESRAVDVVENVSYHDALKGASAGALIGAGLGLTVGVGWIVHDLATASTASHMSPQGVGLAASVMFGLPGALVGGIIGAIVGERERYVFTSTRADQNK